MKKSKTFCDACGIEITRKNNFLLEARITLSEHRGLFLEGTKIDPDLCRSCGIKVYNFLTGRSKGVLK